MVCLTVALGFSNTDRLSAPRGQEKGEIEEARERNPKDKSSASKNFEESWEEQKKRSKHWGR
jgi:hypothetical protein